MSLFMLLTPQPRRLVSSEMSRTIWRMRRKGIFATVVGEKMSPSYMSTCGMESIERVTFT